MTPRRNKAMILIYTVVCMTALMALVSLAVDWGQVQTAKEELQNATDAASRYAVIGIRDGTTLAKAQQAAIQNSVDGSTVALTSADVVVGTWDPIFRTFTAGGSNINSVQVTGRRTGARGTAVPLIFAQVIGKSTCDVTATSVAYQPVTPYSMVALNSLTMSGTTSISRAAAEIASGSVIVESNGTWSIGSGAAINGDVLYRGSAPSGTITGAKTYISSDIAYGTPTTPGTAMNVGAINYTSGSFPVAGDYAVSQCTVSGTFTISLTADTNMYCSGACSFGGNAQVITNGHKMTIYMTSASTIAFTNNLPLSVVIYGPTSTMTVNAPGKITGSFVCKSLNMSNGAIEYTSALPIPYAPTGGGAATVSTGVSTVMMPPQLH